MPDRRPLRFSQLDEVPADVDRLLLGHETVGGWSLAQICNHLVAALRLTALPSGDLLSVTISTEVERAQRIARRRYFRSEVFPEGIELPIPLLDPGAKDADPRVAAEALRVAISQFLDAKGPFPMHPMLGRMDRDEWRHFHRIHCAHHLSFALPISSDETTGAIA